MGGCWEFQECQGMSGMLRISVDTERHQVGNFGMSGMSIILRMSGETERHDGNYRNGRGISECGECQQFLEWREYQEC